MLGISLRGAMGGIDLCRTCVTPVKQLQVSDFFHTVFESRGNNRSIEAASAMKGADFVWDKEKLDRFIAKPDEVVPGNNMKLYGGITSAEDRAKVIVFLESPTTN
jgi:cytochrome c